MKGYRLSNPIFFWRKLYWTWKLYKNNFCCREWNIHRVQNILLEMETSE